MGVVKADIFEPLQIVRGLKQVYSDTTHLPLNQHGYADYVIDKPDSTPDNQWERKQVPEILSSIDSVEDQLRRELQAKPDIPLGLMVEGIAEPAPGGIQTYILATNGAVFRKGKFFKTRYERYEGFLVGLQQMGITVWRTTSWEGTVEALVRFQKHALNPDHTILNRYLKIPMFHPDPHVVTLMGIKGAEIGPKTAEALIAAFGTAWDVMRQDAETLAEHVPGVGLVSAQKIVDAIRVRK